MLKTGLLYYKVMTSDVELENVSIGAGSNLLAEFDLFGY